MVEPKCAGIDPWLEKALDRLINQSDFGACLYSFSKTIVDRPENHAKIVNSYAGHAVQIQNQCVLNEFQIWLARLWEKTGYSLPEFCRKLTGKHEAIANARFAKHPDWSAANLEMDQLEGIISKFCTEVDDIYNSDLAARLRVRRNEKFSHLADNSGSRKRLKSLKVEDGYSFNELFPLASKSLELISEARRILRFEIAGQQQFIDMMSEHYESYWRLLPNFSEVENAS